MKPKIPVVPFTEKYTRRDDEDFANDDSAYNTVSNRVAELEGNNNEEYCPGHERSGSQAEHQCDGIFRAIRRMSGTENGVVSTATVHVGNEFGGHVGNNQEDGRREFPTPSNDPNFRSPTTGGERKSMRCTICAQPLKPEARSTPSSPETKVKRYARKSSASTLTGTVNPAFITDANGNMRSILKRGSTDEAGYTNGGFVLGTNGMVEIPLDQVVYGQNGVTVMAAAGKGKHVHMNDGTSIIPYHRDSLVSTETSTVYGEPGPGRGSDAGMRRRKSIAQAVFGTGREARRFSCDIQAAAVNTARRKSQQIGHIPSLGSIKDEDDEDSADDEHETIKVLLLQVFIPFLIAGFGNVGAGLILDTVQHWRVFNEISELFILVASFLCFKSIIEMTLAARLATQAHMGQLDTRGGQLYSTGGNIAAVQCQAITVSTLASCMAITAHWIHVGKFELDKTLVIMATSMMTGSLCAFVMTIMMVLVVIFSRKYDVNPDNVSTLFAAFLGDVGAVLVLSNIAKLQFMLIVDYPQYGFWVLSAIIICYLITIVVCGIVAWRNNVTKPVVTSGWGPLLYAMVVSSCAGFVFDHAVSLFDNIAIVQPVINGVGSNLVAVQASRISTWYHTRSNLGILPESLRAGYKTCQGPWRAFIGKNANVRTARALVLMAIPAHLVYLGTLKLIQPEVITLSSTFVGIYLLVGITQLSFLLYLAHTLVPICWLRKIDPDNAAIPACMSAGDLTGTVLLTAAFLLMQAFSLVDDPAFQNPSNVNVTLSPIETGNATLLSVLSNVTQLTSF